MERAKQLLATSKTKGGEGAAKLIAEATAILSQELEQAVAKHGELAPETAEYYLEYGRALLKNASKGSDVFGSSLSRSAEAADGEAQEAVETARASEDDLQLSFEILDAARVVYSKIESKDAQLKLADVHSTIADVLMESDDFQGACVDFEKCLNIQKRLLEPYNRKMAASHMNLACCALFVKDGARAIAHYRAAFDVFQKHVAHLLEKITGGSDASSKSEAPSASLTLKDLNELEKQYPTESDSFADIRDMMEIMNEITERITDLIRPAEPESEDTESSFKMDTSFPASGSIVRETGPESKSSISETSEKVHVLTVKRKTPSPASFSSSSSSGAVQSHLALPSSSTASHPQDSTPQDPPRTSVLANGSQSSSSVASSPLTEPEERPTKRIKASDD